MHQPQNRIVLTKELVEAFYNEDYPINSHHTNDKSMHGMYLNDILDATDDWWEQCHCFIQILFPNPIPSKMNPDAPIIEDFSVFDGVYRYPICLAVIKFLSFLGIGFIDRSYTNYHRVSEWFRPDNHNILRVTRLLIFLKGVGMIAELNALKKFLAEFQRNIPDVKLRDSMLYTMTIWQNV